MALLENPYIPMIPYSYSIVLEMSFDDITAKYHDLIHDVIMLSTSFDDTLSRLMNSHLATSDGRNIPIFPIIPAETTTNEQLFLQKCSKAFGCALEKVINSFIMENPIELAGVAFEEYVIAAGSEPSEIAISDPAYIDKQKCLRAKFCFRVLELSLFFGATSTETNTHLQELFPLSPEHAQQYVDMLAQPLKSAKPYHPVPLIEGSVLGFLEHLAFRRVLQLLPQTYPLASLRLIQAVNGITKRLSNVQHYALAGRALLLSSLVYPVDERSGVNVQGAFNTDNRALPATDAEQLEGDGSTPAADEEGTCSLSELYTRFWALQATFADPLSLLAEGAFPAFAAQLQSVLAGLREVPLDAQRPPVYPQGALAASTAARTHAGVRRFPDFPKGLPAPSLFKLQLADVDVRRAVLLQTLFFLVALHAPEAAHAPSLDKLHAMLTPRYAQEIAQMLRAVLVALAQGAPDGPAFSQAVHRLLVERETIWQQWKRQRCPPLAVSDVVLPLAQPSYVVDASVVWTANPVLGELRRDAEEVALQLDRDDDCAGVQLRLTDDAGAFKHTLLPMGAPLALMQCGLAAARAVEQPRVDLSTFDPLAAVAAEAGSAYGWAKLNAHERAPGDQPPFRGGAAADTTTRDGRLLISKPQLLALCLRNASKTDTDAAEAYAALHEDEDEVVEVRALRAARSQRFSQFCIARGNARALTGLIPVPASVLAEADAEGAVERLLAEEARAKAVRDRKAAKQQQAEAIAAATRAEAAANAQASRGGTSSRSDKGGDRAAEKPDRDRGDTDRDRDREASKQQKQPSKPQEPSRSGARPAPSTTDDKRDRRSAQQLPQHKPQQQEKASVPSREADSATAASRGPSRTPASSGAESRAPPAQAPVQPQTSEQIGADAQRSKESQSKPSTVATAAATSTSAKPTPSSSPTAPTTPHPRLTLAHPPSSGNSSSPSAPARGDESSRGRGRGGNYRTGGRDRPDGDNSSTRSFDSRRGRDEGEHGEHPNKRVRFRR